MSRSARPEARALLRGLVLIATLALVGTLFERVGLGSLLREDWVDAQVRGHGLAGLGLFLLAAMLATALGVPRQLPSFLGGYAFGAAEGTALAVLGTLAGAAVSFQYARFMGRDFLVRRFPHRIKKIDDFLAGKTFLMTLVVRLSPFANNLATNLAAGVSGVRLPPFLAGSAVGYLPQTLVFALVGSGVSVDGRLRMVAGAGLFVASSLLGVWIWRRTRRGLPEELPDAEG